MAQTPKPPDIERFNEYDWKFEKTILVNNSLMGRMQGKSIQINTVAARIPLNEFKNFIGFFKIFSEQNHIGAVHYNQGIAKITSDASIQRLIDNGAEIEGIEHFKPIEKDARSR